MLLGGFVGKDGWVTSAPFLGLRAQIAAQFPQAKIVVDTWDDYRTVGDQIAEHQSDKIVLIGYSGGGSRATWLANEFRTNDRIDLMVLYDPSPRWQMKDIGNTKVIKCLQYYNSSPKFFLLGGGFCKGPQVTTIDIAQFHPAVQSNQALHDRTLGAIRQVTA